MRLLPAFVVLTGGLALHAATLPQAAGGPGDGSMRLTIVVTDREGRAVTGLKPADFDVQVDGKPQPLDSVELTNSDTASPRTFAFLLDEFHTAAEHSAAIRESLLRFVDRHLRPADLAVVVKPLDSLTSIVPNADRAALRNAIATFEGRKGDFTPRTAFERNYMAQAPDAVAWGRAQIVTSALRAAAMSLSNTTDTRGVIVLVSDGFERMRSSREVPANLQAAIRIANRSDAPVYAFSASPAPPAGPDAKVVDPAFAALTALATQTGGLLETGIGALEAGLARMNRDLDAHYVLGYQATHGGDGKYHAITVAVRRPGAQIRVRSGYVAPMSAELRAAHAQRATAPLRVLRRSALIRTWSGIVPTRPGFANITLTWEPPPPRAATTARGRAASIVVGASTPDGDVLFDGAVAAVGAATDTATDHARFEAPIGPVRIDIKVLDAKGIVIDTDARDVVVPGPKAAGPTIFPPAVLRTRSAREFREVSEDATAAPVPAREFRRTERLLIRVPALDASGESTPVSGTLLNRLRQPMRPLEAMESTAVHGVTQFDLPLAPLAPGDYSIRLTVPGPKGDVTEFVTFRVGG
ncbi:MAG: VWA domain-containing protein [Vicinamibacterales bacterium]